MSAATGQKIQLPMPHAGQKIVLQQMKRFSYLAAGRRWRKSTLAMAIAVQMALQGKRVMWGAPTFDQVRVGWGEMKKACAGTFHFHHTQMTAESPTGGKVVFRSLDNPDNARGHSADYIILDETADIVEEAWYEVLRPMLIDTRGGALFLGTPKGRNWFWREHEMAQDRPDAIAWQVPTVGARVVDGHLIRQHHPMENPDVPFSELEQMFATTPERVFRQEILAEFLENAGGVFQNVRDCVGGDLEADPSHPVRQYLMGVDVAKYNDYTVCVVVDKLDRRVVDFARYNLVDWHVQKQRIYNMAKHWNNALTWIDSTGVGDPIYEDLKRSDLRIHPYQFTQRTKKELVDNGVLMVEQRQVTFPGSLTTLISELSSYEYERLPGGGLRTSAPSGMHDDCVMAFCLALWPLAHQSAPMPNDFVERMQTTWSDLNANKLMGKTF